MTYIKQYRTNNCTNGYSKSGRCAISPTCPTTVFNSLIAAKTASHAQACRLWTRVEHYTVPIPSSLLSCTPRGKLDWHPAWLQHLQSIRSTLIGDDALRWEISAASRKGVIHSWCEVPMRLLPTSLNRKRSRNTPCVLRMRFFVECSVCNMVLGNPLIC